MKHKSKDLKLKAVLYYYQSKTQTSKIFGCSPRALMGCVRKFNNCCSFSKNNKMYLGYKLKQVHINFINNCVLQNKTITMKKLKEYILLEFSLKIPELHLSHVAQKIGFSFKKVKLEHKPNTCYGKVKDVNILLKEFYLTVHKFKIKDIICIDETSLSSFLIRNYGYSKKGKRCVIQINNWNVFKKYTGIFAMTTEEILSYTIYLKGGMDSHRLIEFSDKFLSEQKNKLTILDNASSHKNSSLSYLVPHQHRTQAIEGFFNVLKSRLKQKNSDLNYNNLCLNINHVISKIPKSFYLNLIKETYRKRFYKAEHLVKLYCFTKLFKLYYGFWEVDV